MSLRTILYGYEFKNGKPVALESEATVVRGIFADYIGGKSLKAIAVELTEQGIIYYLDKSVWTKNLIARIIENPKYRGTYGYTVIIGSAEKYIYQDGSRWYVEPIPVGGDGSEKSIDV